MRCWQTTSARPPRATASNSARSGPTAANYAPRQNSSAQATTITARHDIHPTRRAWTGGPLIRVVLAHDQPRSPHVGAGGMPGLAPLRAQIVLHLAGGT